MDNTNKIGFDRDSVNVLYIFFESILCERVVENEFAKMHKTQSLVSVF